MGQEYQNCEEPETFEKKSQTIFCPCNKSCKNYKLCTAIEFESLDKRLQSIL